MNIGKLIEQLKSYESVDGHVVVTNTETKQRMEIEETWFDGDGVLNIITTGRSAGEMDEDLIREVFENQTA